MKNSKYILASSKPWHEPNAPDFISDDARFLWASNPEHLDNLIQDIGGVRYIFFLHWNWLVPRRVWKQYECVCFHMTDVPYGRGGSPLQNLIVRGHERTMLSALRMVEEYDSGPVYAKRSLSLAGTALEIYERAGRLSFEMIRMMIESPTEPVPQEGEAIVFTRRTPEQSILPNSGELERVYDHIRMLDAPTYPPAFVEHGEFLIEFSDARLQDKELSATVSIRRKSDRDMT